MKKIPKYVIIDQKESEESIMTKYFEEIEDSRQQGKIKYELVEVIVITILAVVLYHKKSTERSGVRFL